MEPVIDQSYAARRAALVDLDLPAVVVTPSFAWDDAPALLAACEDTGMEGVMLKRLDSPYLPGKRTEAWRNVKCAAWVEHGRQRFHTRRTLGSEGEHEACESRSTLSVAEPL